MSLLAIGEDQAGAFLGDHQGGGVGVPVIYYGHFYVCNDHECVLFVILP